MKHKQVCPDCSGYGILKDDRGLDEICRKCAGKGFIFFRSREKVFATRFMKLVLFSVLFLIIFYILFVVYITTFKADFTIEIIILFIGHAALATVLISYLMIKSLYEGKNGA